MKNCNMSNMDGEVLDFEVMNASSPIGANLKEDYDTTFWTGEDFNNASGRFRKERARRRKLREEKQQQRQDRRNLRTSSKAEARQIRATAKQTKAEAKIGEADAKKEMAKGLQDQSGDIALANALASKPAETPSAEKKGLSTGAKIGIGVGVLAVLGVVGYMLYKKSQKGK